MKVWLTISTGRYNLHSTGKSNVDGISSQFCITCYGITSFNYKVPRRQGWHAHLSMLSSTKAYCPKYLYQELGYPLLTLKKHKTITFNITYLIIVF
jgi:hypothetical protein